MNQLVEVLNGANQSVVQYQYDAAGNVIEAVSPTETGSRTTLHQYDALGRLRQTTDALNAVTAFDFNLRDELVRVEDARELATGYTVNPQVRYPATPTLNVTYTYDQGSHGKGRLTRIDDDTGHTLYAYDAFGNVTSQTQVTTGHSFTTHYSYNTDNQVTAITYPSGRVVNYQYDTLGNISDITTTDNGTSTGLVSGASYLPFGSGSATGWTLGNGLTVTRQFDLDYRLTALITSPVMDITYAYDPAGNIVQMVDQLSLTRSQSFGYDLADRLTDASGLYGEQEYTYDLVGNRLGKTQTNGSTTTDTYSYALTSNRLTDINGSTSQVITYDATGNIISRGSDTLTYNARNRLVEVKRNGITLATYKHNGKGERVSKTVHSPTGNATTYFVYDLAGNIIAEADTTGAVTKEYAYSNGERLAMFTYGAANEIYYYHNDHLGTPKVITDATGAIVWQGDYTPFGEVTETVNLIEQPFRFPGQYFDSETNLHYNYYRDYDPSIGRYIQSDPIGLPGGINTYLYANANPLSFVDYYGLSACPPQTFMSCQQKCASVGLTVKSCSATNIIVADIWTCNCDESCPINSYENPGHHDPSNQGPNPYNRTKSRLPENHDELWSNSRPGSDGNRWTKVGSGKKVEYHRFQNNGNGQWHWNGSTNGTTSSGASRPINMNNVPNDVKKW